jgi:hypothetical protein
MQQLFSVSYFPSDFILMAAAQAPVYTSNKRGITRHAQEPQAKGENKERDYRSWGQLGGVQNRRVATG